MVTDNTLISESLNNLSTLKQYDVSVRDVSYTYYQVWVTDEDDAKQRLWNGNAVKLHNEIIDSTVSAVVETDVD
jgi:hypothetical protein